MSNRRAWRIKKYGLGHTSRDLALVIVARCLRILCGHRLGVSYLFEWSQISTFRRLSLPPSPGMDMISDNADDGGRDNRPDLTSFLIWTWPKPVSIYYKWYSWRDEESNWRPHLWWQVVWQRFTHGKLKALGCHLFIIIIFFSRIRVCKNMSLLALPRLFSPLPACNVFRAVDGF
jgi:hypothetical protein